MSTLTREVRFAVNPFLPETPVGENSHCAKPGGTGLAIYFSLWIELAGSVNPATGFVVNVVEIDKRVREKCVDLFQSFITDRYRRRQHITINYLAEILQLALSRLKNTFAPVKIESLSLSVMPNRKLQVKHKEPDMMYFGEKFEFAASHKLWNDSLSDEQNFRHFGKCANPSGHGHNYVIEVIIKKPASDKAFSIGDYQQMVKENFIDMVDHKNLNSDVEYFKTHNPTIENISEFAFEILKDKFEDADLDSITVWESSRTFCRCRG